jgi:hypothetical protein
MVRATPQITLPAFAEREKNVPSPALAGEGEGEGVP